MATLQSLADAPGRQREYETIMIVHPNTQNDGVASLNDRLKGVVEAQGGTVIKVDNWGKRRLAYEVGSELRGIYLYWQFLGTTGLVDELERTLRLIDGVLRYQTVRIDDDIDPGARPSEMDDDAYARAAETAADEEDMMTSSGGEGEEGEGGDGEGGDGEDGDGVEARADGEGDGEGGDGAKAKAEGDGEGDDGVEARADGDASDSDASDDSESDESDEEKGN